MAKKEPGDINLGQELKLIEDDKIIEENKITNFEEKNESNNHKKYLRNSVFILILVILSLSIIALVYSHPFDMKSKVSQDPFYLKSKEKNDKKDSPKKKEETKSELELDDPTRSRIINLREFINLMPKKPKKLTKIFWAERDGFYSSKFHKLCDDQGNTLIIIHSSKDTIFAAYTEQSWKYTTKEEIFKPDPNAYIINIGNKEVAMASNGAGIYRDPDLGPAFGGYLKEQRYRGYDYAIKIIDICDDYPLSYTTRHEGFNNIRIQLYNERKEEKFYVKDYEVFKVEY